MIDTLHISTAWENGKPVMVHGVFTSPEFARPVYVQRPEMVKLLKLLIEWLEETDGKPHGNNPGRVDVPGQKG